MQLKYDKIKCMDGNSPVPTPKQIDWVKNIISDTT